MADGRINSENKYKLWHGPLVPILTVILCLLPFVNKAFHIDDPLFIWAAQHIQKHPLDFYGFNVHWYATEMPMFDVTKNPPLACYYMAGIARLVGFSEVGLHLGFMILAIAAAAGTFYLARRYCSHPVLAAMITIVTPVFLVSGTTLMCDMLLLAFWVWALFFWMRGIDCGRQTDLLIAVIFVSLAIVTKYFGIALIPLLFVYAVIKNPRRRIWLVYFLMPMAVMAVYQWLTTGLYGKGLLSDAFTYSSVITAKPVPSFFYQVLVALAFAGGCFIPVLFYSPFLWSRRILCAGVILLLSCVVILYFSPPLCNIVLRDANQVRWNLIVTLSLMALAGVSLLGLMWEELRRSRNGEMMVLLCWIGGTFLFAGFINWSINARSMLPMVPAVGILITRGMERRTSGGWRNIFRYIFPLLMSAFVAVSVTRADYLLAGCGQTAAAVVNQKYAGEKLQIWFEGHWGFQYYMQAQGSKPIDVNKPRPLPGDIVVVPRNNTNTIPLNMNRVQLRERLGIILCSWVTTKHCDMGASFYSHFLGPVPFLFGPIPPEEYDVFEIKPRQPN